jgi:phosphatidate cytidylyltransferase
VNSSGSLLKTRLPTAVALLAGFLAALFLLPQTLWIGLLALILFVAGSEWAGLMGWQGTLRLAYPLSTVLVALLIAWLTVFRGGDTAALPVYATSLLFWLLVVPFWLHGRWRPFSPVLQAATGWLALIPAWVALVQVRAASPNLVLAMLAVVWVADSAAYFTGRAFGKRRLAPGISPGKTWEGVWGAWLAVTLYGLVVWRLAGPEACARLCWLIGALALWGMLGASILGDLFESLLKRQAGLKDSGRLLPGHGGILDRIDGLNAALPLAALIWLYDASRT